MFNEGVAEQVPRRFRALQPFGGFAQAAGQGQTFGVGLIIGVAPHGGGRFQALFQAPQAGADGGGLGQVGVGIGGGDPEFDSLGFRPAADRAQGASPVVDAPGRLRRAQKPGISRV